MKTVKDFPPGTRVRYRTTKHGYASTSVNGLYVHLGATPYLTGTVTHETPLHDQSVAFRPDGWPLPEGVSPIGFMAQIANLEPISLEHPRNACVITNGVGVPYPPQEIQRLVNEYLSKKGF